MRFKFTRTPPILAAFLLIYSAVADRIERSWISLSARQKEEVLRGAESMGEALALLTWVVFGAGVVAKMLDGVTWQALLYAVLSLTVVRMLPVFRCLFGPRTSMADKLFIGWFGPRGLATIVFSVLVLHENCPATTRSYSRPAGRCCSASSPTA